MNYNSFCVFHMDGIMHGWMDGWRKHTTTTIERSSNKQNQQQQQVVNDPIIY